MNTKKILITLLSIVLQFVGVVLLLPTTLGTLSLYWAKRVHCAVLKDHIFNYNLLYVGVNPADLKCIICEAQASPKDVIKLYEIFGGVIQAAAELSKTPPESSIEETINVPENKILVTTQSGVTNN